MANFDIIDQTIGVLSKSLDLRMRKQQVVASNIANAETPGYAARKLDFEADLQRAMVTPEVQAKKHNPRHIPVGTGGIDAVQGTISRQPDSNPLGDGNSVSIDDEMLELAENQLLYEASSQMLKKKFAMLKYAVSDGR
jgi:flagellar basal-body rod protein FlgB